MRVLVVHNFYRWRGGEDEAAVRSAEMLEARGHTVERFFADSRELQGASLLQRAYAATQTVYSWPVAKSLRDVVRRFRPDVAHIFNVMPLLSPSVYWALDRQRVPAVHSIQNFRLVCPNGFAFTHGEICWRCRHGNVLPSIRLKCCHDDLTQTALYAATVGLHRWLGTYARKAGHLLPVNSLLAQVLREEYPQTPITILPNFVDTRQYTARVGFRDSFAYLGRLFPEKGVATLLEAIGQLPGIELELVGDGLLEADLRKTALACAPGRVVFHGRIDSLARFEPVRRARALVVPSLSHDACPLVVLEAMAQGVPVVASRRGGLPDLIAEGDSGLLFEAGHASDLARQLQRLASSNELVSQMGVNARRRAEDVLDIDVHYRKLQEIYAQTLEAHARVA